MLTGLAAQDPAGVAERLASTGLPVTGAVLDATDEAAICTLVDVRAGRRGADHAVVCSAGAALDTGPHTTTTDGQLDAMFDLHVRGVLRLANATIPAMAERGGGAFVVLSSIAGLRGNRLLGGYGVTKVANAQLVRNLAVQWGAANVRVNAISPGVIATDSLARSRRSPPSRPRASRRHRSAGSAPPTRSRGRSSGWPLPRAPSSPGRTS